MDDIVALARHELPALRPDIVTLYEGVNDAFWPKPRHQAEKIYRLKDWLYFHSILWRVVHSSVKYIYYSFVHTTSMDPIALPHIGGLELTESQIERLREKVRYNYGVNLEKLHEVTAEVGATLILITQNHNLKMQAGSGFEDKWRTYEEELAIVQEMYRKKRTLNHTQVAFLVHSDLQNELKQFAKEKYLGLVDGIAALKRDPSQMLSYVHLLPLGNQWIAEAIRDYLDTKKIIADSAVAIQKKKEPSGLFVVP